MIASAREQAIGGGKGRILVIDDEVEIRESLETLLDLEGYEVDLAPSGTDGERRRNPAWKCCAMCGNATGTRRFS